MALKAVQHGAQDYIVKRHLEASFVRRAVRYAIERKRIRNELALAAQRERALRIEAEAANRAKDEFFMMLSHELKTPLNPIIGWVNLIHTGDITGDDLRHAPDRRSGDGPDDQGTKPSSGGIGTSSGRDGA